jgi:hypothetical protein
MKGVRLAGGVLLVVVLFAADLGATHEEFLWGHYSHRSKNLSISFLWNINGISGMKINSRAYADTEVTYDFFGDPGSYVIRVSVSERNLMVIRLALLRMRDKVLLVSGYFADLESPDPESDFFKVKFMKTIEMKFKPLSEVEKEQMDKAPKQKKKVSS